MPTVPSTLPRLAPAIMAGVFSYSNKKRQAAGRKAAGYIKEKRQAAGRRIYKRKEAGRRPQDT